MKILSEKKVHTDEYAGCIDILTGFDDFDSELEFDEMWHSYTYKDKILPSVTQLLDDGSYDKIDKKILEYAQTRGTIIHGEVEDYLKHGEMGFTDEFYNFLDLFNENEELFEQRAIFDIKTYSVATPKNREKCYKQETKYADAVKYMTGEKVEHFYLIHLPKTGKSRIYDLGDEFNDKKN